MSIDEDRMLQDPCLKVSMLYIFVCRGPEVDKMLAKFVLYHAWYFLYIKLFCMCLYVSVCIYVSVWNLHLLRCIH